MHNLPPPPPPGTTPNRYLPAPKTTSRWYEKKRFRIGGSLLGLIAITSALSPNQESEDLGVPAEELAFVDTDGETTLPSSTNPSTTAEPEPEFFQPKAEDGEDIDGPFWTTTFGLTFPADTWESNSADPSTCQPKGESDYQLKNDSGVLIAPFDDTQTLTFGRTGSKISGEDCLVKVATLGDFEDDLGEEYTITNGSLLFIFTPEELFSGQDGDVDSYKKSDPSSISIEPTTSSTLPETTAPKETPPPETTAAPTVPPTVAPPTMPPTPQPTVAPEPSPAPIFVHPGSFCSSTGAAGQTEQGTAMICANTNKEGEPYAGGRSRWRSP